MNGVLSRAVTSLVASTVVSFAAALSLAAQDPNFQLRETRVEQKITVEIKRPDESKLVWDIPKAPAAGTNLVTDVVLSEFRFDKDKNQIVSENRKFSLTNIVRRLGDGRFEVVSDSGRQTNMFTEGNVLDSRGLLTVTNWITITSAVPVGISSTSAVPGLVTYSQLTNSYASERFSNSGTNTEAISNDVIQREIRLLRDTYKTNYEHLRYWEKTPPPGGTETNYSPAVRKERQIARTAYKSIQAELSSAAETFVESYIYDFFYHFTAGAVLVNPYTITSTTNGFEMDSSETDTRLYLAFTYVERWVAHDTVAMQDGWCFQPGRLSSWHENHLMDYWGDIGFVFGSTADPTNSYNGSALIGGGEINAQFGLGFPLYRRMQSPGHTHSLNFEGSFGVVTDTAALQVHQTAFCGLAYLVGFSVAPPKDSSEKAKMGFVKFAVGGGAVEIPEFMGDSSTMINEERGLPKFDVEYCPTVDVALHYPIFKNQGSFISIGSQIFIRDTPSPWRVTFSGTIAAEKIFGALSGLFGVVE